MTSESFDQHLPIDCTYCGEQIESLDEYGEHLETCYSGWFRYTPRQIQTIVWILLVSLALVGIILTWEFITFLSGCFPL